jgi:hypothetical protein
MEKTRMCEKCLGVSSTLFGYYVNTGGGQRWEKYLSIHQLIYYGIAYDFFFFVMRKPVATLAAVVVGTAGVKKAEREADESLRASAEVKNA